MRDKIAIRDRLRRLGIVQVDRNVYPFCSNDFNDSNLSSCIASGSIGFGLRL